MAFINVETILVLRPFILRPLRMEISSQRDLRRPFIARSFRRFLRAT